MTRFKVFLDRAIPAQVKNYLSECCDVRIGSADYPPAREKMLAQLHDVEGLLTSSVRIDQELLDHAPRLKVVSNVSVGYNNFDLQAMEARRVIGTYTPYVLDDTVADLVFGLILAAARRIPELDRHVKNGSWRKGNDQQLFGLDVHHSTIGIIGLGRIGEKIARRAKYGFQMDVLYYNRTPSETAEREFGAQYRPIDSLLAESDFIVVMVPLNERTIKMIGRREFSLMKRTAIFINASRGQVVDESALIDALREGKIHAAGLDVFEKEPVEPDNPLLALPNVVALPHIGSATAKTRSDMLQAAAENLVLALTESKPPNPVRELEHLLR